MTIPLQFPSLYDGQVFVWSDCLLDLGTDLLVGNMVFVFLYLYISYLYEMRGILRQHLISMACILLWSSAVRVHDSQT